jgi:hypothetical protein
LSFDSPRSRRSTGWRRSWPKGLSGWLRPVGRKIAVRGRIVKILISHSEPISSSVDHCHPSRFFIGNRPTVQSTIYSYRLVSSLSVVAINNAFVSAQGPPQPQLDRDLVANSRGVAGACPTARGTLQWHNEFPRLEETTGRWTSPDNFAQRDNAQRIPSSLVATNVRQRE